MSTVDPRSDELREQTTSRGRTPAAVPGSHDRIPRGGLDDRTATHLLAILSVSAGLVGVCLTAIGLIGIARAVSRLESICDDLLAADALLYLLAAGLSFAGLRTPLRQNAELVARSVDAIFCAALVLTAAACVLLVWFVV